MHNLVLIDTEVELQSRYLNSVLLHVFSLLWRLWDLTIANTYPKSSFLLRDPIWSPRALFGKVVYCRLIFLIHENTASGGNLDCWYQAWLGKVNKINLPEKGNEHLNVIPADLAFVIDEKPHGKFTREGNDLVVTKKTPLVGALTGCTIHLTTLNGEVRNQDQIPNKANF